jgi:hypothetical protein
MLQELSDDVLQEILQRKHQQEAISKFLLEIISKKHIPKKCFEIICEKHPEVLNLAIGISGNQIDFSNISKPEAGHIGFPLFFVAKRLLQNKGNFVEETACLYYMKLLLENEADVNARFQNHPTPVHLASECGAWTVVNLLVSYGANVDIEINDTTAREIIRITENIPVQNTLTFSIPSVSLQTLMYEALYANDETAFLAILRVDPSIDLNEHNGVVTLLQLAIIKKLPKSCKKLINRGADVNKMAGLCIEPILLAIRNPECECLRILHKYINQINFRFAKGAGTFFHSLNDIQCKHIEKFRDIFSSLIKKAFEQGVNICAVNNWEKTALENICTNTNPSLFYLFLDRFGFSGITRSIIERTSPKVFVKYFDTKISQVSETNSTFSSIGAQSTTNVYKIFDFEFLGQKKTNNNLYENARTAEMLPFYEMCKFRSYRNTVLLHPLVNLFLIYKWRKIAYIYVLNFIFYLLFTIMLSFHVYLLTIEAGPMSNAKDIPSNTFQEINNKNYLAEIKKIGTYFTYLPVLEITIIFWSLIALREIFQMIISFRYYIRNTENYLEIPLLVFSMLTFFEQTNKIKWILALAIILSYLELTLLCSWYPITGPYVTMFIRVSLKSIRLLITFSCFIFAFTYSFFVLYYDLHFKDNEKQNFSSVWDSILETMVMAVGVLDVSYVHDSNSISIHILFFFFIVFVTIILMNLLNALAVSDTQNIINKSETLCCLQSIHHYTRIESLILGYDPDNCSNADRICGINRHHNIFSKIASYFPVLILPLKCCGEKQCHLCRHDKLVLCVVNNKCYAHVYLYKSVKKLHPRNIPRWLTNFYNYKLLNCKEKNMSDQFWKRLNDAEKIKKEDVEDIKEETFRQLQQIQNQISNMQSEMCALNYMYSADMKSLITEIKSQQMMILQLMMPEFKAE